MVYKVEKSNKKMKLKEKQRKGLWSPEEDEKLRSYVLKHGHGCWTSLPLQAGIERNGKSCRLRWVNYLRPGLKKGLFTKDEESTLLYLHSILGNKWSQISQHLPGRTDNEVKNYWHSYLKKKINLTIPKITNSQSISQEKSYEILHNTDVEKRINSQILKFSPKFVFSEWLDSSLVMDQSSQSSNYVEELGKETTKTSYPNYSEINTNYMEDIVKNTNFMLDDGISEIEFCSSFSDSFLFDCLINEQQQM